MIKEDTLDPLCSSITNINNAIQFTDSILVYIFHLSLSQYLSSSKRVIVSNQYLYKEVFLDLARFLIALKIIITETKKTYRKIRNHKNYLETLNYILVNEHLIALEVTVSSS